MPATLIADHVDRALDRLRQQFRDQPNIEAWLRVLVAPVQDLEQAMYEVLVGRGVETAVGVQLDAIGTIVGQPRNGRSDEVYRAFIRARIATNKSNGTIENVLNVTTLVLDDEDVTLNLHNSGPGWLLLKLEDAPVTLELTLLLVVYFLRRVVAAGVRINVEASAADPADWFTWGDDWDDPSKVWVGAYA